MTPVPWIFVGLFFICHCHETPPKKCLRHQFRCSDGRQCIPLHRRCDRRHVDCADGSDEGGDCARDSDFRCPRGDHRCRNSRCLPETFVCDGTPDCHNDESDEVDCYRFPTTSDVCLKNQFPCTNGTCIPMFQRCDGVPGDCPVFGISEEHGCEKRRCREPGDHRCGSGLCLSPSLVCDGVAQCNDSSDEENCKSCEKWGCSHFCVEESDGPRCFCEKGFHLSPQDERTCMETCLRNEFRCSDGGRCVRMLQRCDGREDCRDGSDERDCKEFECPEFLCGNGRQCLPDSFVCDGWWRDCDDGSDERHCAPVNGSCLKNHFRCPEGQCIPLRWRCDGEPDCTGASDEADCGSRTCPAGYHRCTSGQCISGMLACDGVEDCDDGSDEKDCDTCENWGCCQKCQDTSLGPRCLCDEGLKLDAQDERTCRTPPMKAPVPPCFPYQFVCGTGQCLLSRSYVCNGDEECSDGSDEKGCEPLANGTCAAGRSLCKNYCSECADDRRYCIPNSFLCDGMKDCAPPFDDEAGCTPPAPPRYGRCNARPILL